MTKITLLVIMLSVIIYLIKELKKDGFFKK